MLFRVAEIVGSTVADLLDPPPPRHPLTIEELYAWAAYLTRKSDLEKQAIEAAKRS